MHLLTQLTQLTQGILLLAIGVGATGLWAVDPSQITGPNACIDCHQAAHQALDIMQHQANYKTLHRSDSAQDILTNMGLANARREPANCAICHYTSSQPEGRSKPRLIAGVSCESCHGAASSWLDLHNNYGFDANGGRATAATETREHQQQRLAETARLGMIRPDQIYQLAQNCFQCHTVPDEQLVDKGGHTPGSDFELVSWLAGEVRHNFQQSQDKENRQAPRTYDPAQRRRLLFVMGQLLDLEYALRGQTGATGAGTYAQAMDARSQQAKTRLQAIQQAAPALAALLQPAFDGSPDQVQQVALDFAAQHDGSQLAGLDPLIDQPAKGTPFTP
ncbi:MAG: hypothetical protein GKR89_28270 [Candidatus Latescibacteria bacterium]|nr:hypothetical protein [Candidatus Latescibacterota bacterium]